MAGSNARDGSTSPQPAEAPGSDDDTKRKFRAALDRKMAKSPAGSDHKNGGGKQSRTHGPVENRREFRRKSG